MCKLWSFISEEIVPTLSSLFHQPKNSIFQSSNYFPDDLIIVELWEIVLIGCVCVQDINIAHVCGNISLYRTQQDNNQLSEPGWGGIVTSVQGLSPMILPGRQTSDSASGSKFHYMALLVSRSSNFRHWSLLALLVDLVLH